MAKDTKGKGIVMMDKKARQAIKVLAAQFGINMVEFFNRLGKASYDEIAGIINKK